MPAGTTYGLCNLVACYPRDATLRGDNEPERGEILACRPRLIEFVGVAKPKLIVLVGVLAAEYGQGPKDGGIPRCEIIHPAATFPPRMARVQAANAIQHAVVVLRSAAADVLQSR